MDYVFVFKDDGWWLKINSAEQLFNYHDKTESVWSSEFYNLITSKEYGSGMNHATPIAATIGLYGANRKMTPIEATMDFRGTVIGNQLDALLKYGEIYINRKGGYHFKYEGDKLYTQFIRRKELIFPDFKKDEIRVKQFPGGEHFYAYIDDLEVRDGDIIKWNTYEEAYNMALSILNN